MRADYFARWSSRIVLCGAQSLSGGRIIKEGFVFSVGCRGLRCWRSAEATWRMTSQDCSGLSLSWSHCFIVFVCPTVCLISLSKISYFILSFRLKKQQKTDFKPFWHPETKPHPESLFLWLLKLHVLNLYLCKTEKNLNSNVIKLGF